MSATVWGAISLLSLLWGVSFFFTEVALESVPPFSIVTARVALAMVMLWIFILARGYTIPRDPKVWLALAVMGLINNAIPFSLIVWGQQNLSSGLASILNATTPLFAVLVAGFALADERPSKQKMMGVIIGFFGVVIMIGADAFFNLSLNIWPYAALLCATFFYACASAWGRRFARMRIAPIIASAGQLTIASLLLIPLSIIYDRPWEMALPAAKVWLALLSLAFFSTALAFVIYFWILQRAGAVNVLLVTLLVPVWAIFLGLFVLKEQLESQHLLGLGCIMLGLVIIDGRLLSYLWKRKNKGA